MCEINAFFKDESGERIILENVDVLKTDGNKIFLKSLFGDERTIEGHVSEMSFSRHKLIIEAKSG